VKQSSINQKVEMWRY